MYIRSSRLAVHLATPNLGPAAGNRFDHTGAVLSVVLDGKHRFCTEEQLDASAFTTGGVGLMAEFKGPEMENAAMIGGRFHKVGVGMLQKSQETVTNPNLMTLACEPYPTETYQVSASTAAYRQVAPPIDGWAFALGREVSVKDNRLMMTASLTNLGSRTLNLEEYQHNFVHINGREVGPQYHLGLTYPILLREAPRGVIEQRGSSFLFTGSAQQSFFLSTDQIGEAPAYAWRLEHEQECAILSEQVFEKPCRTAIWGLSHVISTEIFIKISLEPGDQKIWTRHWLFEVNK